MTTERRIQDEPEDLFASEEQEEAEEDQESEKTAVEALTSMTKEEAADFNIPQRFTKSGRKRAVPFPIKVRKKWLC
jgi:hypothetical protein